jgi:hypothetical protein
LSADSVSCINSLGRTTSARDRQSTLPIVGAAVLLLLILALCMRARGFDLHFEFPVHIPQGSGKTPHLPGGKVQATGAGSAGFDWAPWVVLAVAGTALVLLMGWLVRNRHEFFASSDATVTTSQADEDRSAFVRELSRAGEWLSDMDDPRQAVIRCWEQLEAAALRLGESRRDSETSTDFTRRVLSHRLHPAVAVNDLHRRFLVARFSDEDIDEEARLAAQQDLTTLLADVSR